MPLAHAHAPAHMALHQAQQQRAQNDAHCDLRCAQGIVGAAWSQGRQRQRCCVPQGQHRPHNRMRFALHSPPPSMPPCLPHLLTTTLVRKGMPQAKAPHVSVKLEPAISTCNVPRQQRRKHTRQHSISKCSPHQLWPHHTGYAWPAWAQCMPSCSLHPTALIFDLMGAGGQVMPPPRPSVDHGGTPPPPSPKHTSPFLHTHTSVSFLKAGSSPHTPQLPRASSSRSHVMPTHSLGSMPARWLADSTSACSSTMLPQLAGSVPTRSFYWVEGGQPGQGICY